MKRVLINDNNLDINDIDYEVIRVKGLIINSNDELLMVDNNNTYQFPGGHIIEEESLEDCLAREINEELGIDVNIDNGPFMMITTYDNNYFNTGSKVCNKIYYYIVRSDVEPDINNLKLDNLERNTDFIILRIKLHDLEAFLNKALDDGRIDANIGREMLLVSSEFKKMFGGI